MVAIVPARHPKAGPRSFVRHHGECLLENSLARSFGAWFESKGTVSVAHVGRGAQIDPEVVASQEGVPIDREGALAGRARPGFYDSPSIGCKVLLLARGQPD